MIAMRPWLFLEVVNDRGMPAAPGESGRLLWTSTVCRGTPFLRYEIGDLASFLQGYEDEAGIGAIHQLQGRSAGLLTLPDGRTINCLYWNHLFKEFPEVQQFQVVLRDLRALRVFLKGAGFSPEREAELRGILLSFLGSVPIELVWVQSIPLTPHGKLVQVVREQASPALPC
jgi:phenylacetate-CoA ligase